MFNDPAMDFWTDIPDTFDITHNSTVSPGDFTVNVKDNDGVTPLQDALVCCW